jgi:hypothetical protein
MTANTCYYKHRVLYLSCRLKSGPLSLDILRIQRTIAKLLLSDPGVYVLNYRPTLASSPCLVAHEVPHMKFRALSGDAKVEVY